MVQVSVNMQTPNLNKRLNDLIKEFIRKIEFQASVDKTNATGTFRKSFTGKLVGNTVSISSPVKYVKNVDEGLDLRKEGRIPNVARIAEWAKLKGLRPYRKLKNGVKFSKITKNTMRSMAIGISMAIKNKGTIKRYQYNGSDIFNRVITSMEKKIGLDISEGFSADLREELRKLVKQHDNVN